MESRCFAVTIYSILYYRILLMTERGSYHPILQGAIGVKCLIFTGYKQALYMCAVCRLALLLNVCQIFTSVTFGRRTVQWWSFEARVFSWESLETLVFHVSALAQSHDTGMSSLGSVSSFHVSSCLIAHECVLTQLTVSLSGIVKWKLC